MPKSAVRHTQIVMSDANDDGEAVRAFDVVEYEDDSVKIEVKHGKEKVYVSAERLLPIITK